MSPTVRNVFEQHGLRRTRQRERIYNALASTRAHPTAEELFHAVQEGEPALSLATVYNTLEAFTSCGLVRKIPCPVGVGACRYDAETGEHVHVTTSDGRIMDLPEDLSSRLLGSLPDEVLDDLERRLGVRIDAINIQIVAEPRRRIEHDPAD